jgi:hypothetical protein
MVPLGVKHLTGKMWKKTGILLPHPPELLDSQLTKTDKSMMVLPGTHLSLSIIPISPFSDFFSFQTLLFMAE